MKSYDLVCARYMIPTAWVSGVHLVRLRLLCGYLLTPLQKVLDLNKTWLDQN